MLYFSADQCTAGEIAFLRIIGIGIDIVDISVFRRRLDEGMVNELFLPEEIEYCSSRARPWESYAARFAAKEASFKALGAGLSQGLRWKNIETVKEGSGAVSVKLSGIAQEMAKSKKIKQVRLSISHSGDNAIAVVTMEG
jgi:holo-[acyl-carrier protein] synthase